jgi:hypothetical protein
VADRDDDSDKFGTVIVAVMQKERRKKKREGADLLTIGYTIYKVSSPRFHHCPIDALCSIFSADPRKGLESSGHELL